MSSATPFIGIDFGTSKCAMSWYNPTTKQAEIIRNHEGKEETPSVVYLGKSESDILVGDRAERKIEEEGIEQQRFVVSVKRNLLIAPTLVSLDGRKYRPVDVAALILRKLKRDAEEGHFHQPVTHAVITYPASFDALQQDKIKEAATLAGFTEVVLLAEPVAAALAYGYTGLKIGNYILVYDFGGGTFDVAVLEHTSEGSFELALIPKGLQECGGDDLDRALYEYCDEVALQTLKRKVSLTADLNLKFLRDCRKRKENLTYSEEETFSSYLPSTNGPIQFQHTLSRTTFEDHIKDHVDRTVSLTQEVMNEANIRNCKVDTVVLIGGSSRVPLVLRSLSNALPLQPYDWHQRDYAVALGAAYQGQEIWKQPAKPDIVVPSKKGEQEVQNKVTRQPATTTSQKSIWSLNKSQKVAIVIGTILSGALDFWAAHGTFPAWYTILVGNISYEISLYTIIFGLLVVTTLFFGATFGPWVGLIVGGVGAFLGDDIAGYGISSWSSNLSVALIGFTVGFVLLKTGGRNSKSSALTFVNTIAAITIVIWTALPSIINVATKVSTASQEIVAYMTSTPIFVVISLIVLPILLAIYGAIVRQKE